MLNWGSKIHSQIFCCPKLLGIQKMKVRKKGILPIKLKLKKIKLQPSTSESSPTFSIVGHAVKT